MSVNLIIPKGLPLLLCQNRQLRNDISVLLELKALHPDGRFKWDIPTLDHEARLCGWKGKTAPHKSLKACLYRLEQLKLCIRKGKGNEDALYLCTWPELLTHFGLSGKVNKYTCYIFPRTNKKVKLLMIEFFMQEERDRFRAARDSKLNRDFELQQAAQSVCSRDLRNDEIARGQLRLFCDHRFGEVESEAEYLLLYARAAKGRFYYKADSHISTQHYSKRLGYKNKNGFCYYKKLMTAGYINVTRREEVVQKGIRTNLEQRSPCIGTFFRDSKTKQNKLRMVDAIEFMAPGIAIPDWKAIIAKSLKKPVKTM